MRLDRRFVAAAILVGWAAGMIALALRRHDVPQVELLAQGALRLEPATYFYVVAQNGRTIGAASSELDTTATGFRSRDIARVRALIAGDSQSVTATSTAYLSRAFALDSFQIAVGGDVRPLRLVGVPRPHSSVLLPTLAPIALMLTRAPKKGTALESWVYNPAARRVERVTLSIAAESLFRVVDSARFDSPNHVWVAAHTDTVRAWKIATPSRAISAWVDSQGRIVAASEAGGATLLRTAYEIATLNPKLQTH